MAWTLNETELTNGKGLTYQVLPHEFWYVVPARTSYSEAEGRVRPTEFAFVMHNARVAQGLLISPSRLTGGARLRPAKRGAGGEAEELLEAIRKEHFPEKPSRFNAYFLNFTEELARQRSKDVLRGNKQVVRCLVVMNGARVHFADMERYERLEGRPDDRNLALTYWDTFTPESDLESSRLEVVADAALYFPDWESFPTLPFEDLIAWQNLHVGAK